MQLQDNNMDDLFRKAAADYPLRTDNDDWDSVGGKLPNGTALGEGGKAVAGKGYSRLLWLLLLLPLGGIGVNYIYHQQQQQLKVNIVNSTDQKQKQSLPNGGENKVDVVANPLQQRLITNDESNIKTAEVQTINKNNAKAENADHQSTASPATATDLINSSLNKENVNTSNKVDNSTTELLLNSSSKPLGNNNDTKKEEALIINSNKENSITSIATIAIKNTDSSLPARREGNTVSSTRKQHFFYAGVMGGVDASTVKFQPINGAGYTLGLLLGYRFSSKWSLEAGILWDKKKYYTDGEYFNTTKANIPAGVQIQDMNGNCNMFEIPIDVKYDFVKKGSGHFFVTAGLSSYVMKKEAYNYTAVYYGQQYNANKSYSNSSRDWFSIAQFSVGYEKQLSKKYNFRIEPYLKIPLQGLGIGSLPITSMGLNVGLTRSFH